MSWWDRYFAPGDLRARQNQQGPPDESKSSTDPAPSPPNIPQRIDATHRTRRQNALLFGGIAFTALSMFVTRRALRRKQLAAYPYLANTAPQLKDPKNAVPHFTQSQGQGQAKAETSKADAGLDAAEALFLATLNVGSIFMLATGAFMKYFDVADSEDLRRFVRYGVGYDIYAGNDEADKELEAWVAGALSKADGTLDMSKENLTKMMAGLGELEQKRKQEAEAIEKTEKTEN